MEKTKKSPKQSTIEKYEIKEDCYINYMEEIPCEPCEPPKFYKRATGRNWYCLCDKRTERCSNPECKVVGAQLGIKVGTSVCEHDRFRTQCKECMGGSFCEHNKIRSYCKECGGGSICEHNNRRSTCKECGGSQVCEHNRERSYCKECGGSQICTHNKIRSTCKECGGVSICKHNIQRSSCKECHPQSYIAKLRRNRRHKATKNHKTTRTLDDLCMTTGEWLKYLHKTFEDRYGRPKTEEDEVHIDEIVPCSAWDLPNDNEYCWHYMNSQWLLAEDNLSKGDSYDEGDKLAMIERIQSS
jgi:hypothetical protein